ncbi:MAG: glycoside hydrolase family 16 protein [Limisphaerales bacterium]
MSLVTGAFLACPMRATPAEAAPGWRLVWADEFNGPDGSAPDPAKWVYDLGGNGWGNNELETYTARRENSRLEGGRLVIEARRESFVGGDGRRRDYTSARLKTLGKAAWTYGRVEARIKVPAGQGLWPAFWMLGANIKQAGWPNSGELDIMENIGREASVVHGTAHGPGYSGGGGIGKPFALPAGRRFADDFHLFALEWQPAKLQWSVDNQVYFTLTPKDLPKGTRWVFDQPQFLLLNVAVGGSWPGAPDAATIFPQQMLVDYVRVYAPVNVPAPDPRTAPKALL